MFRNRTISVSAAALAVGLAALGAVAVQQARSADETPTDLARELTSVGFDETPAATVNGQVISVGRVLAYEALAAQTARLTGTNPPARAEIVQGLISDELLHQEALRRGLGASDAEVESAIEAARAGSTPDLMEFVLAYTSEATGQTLDEDTYWDLPRTREGYRRSITVSRLVSELSGEAGPQGRDAAVADETDRLRSEAEITIAPDFS